MELDYVTLAAKDTVVRILGFSAKTIPEKTWWKMVTEYRNILLDKPHHELEEILDLYP